MNIPQSFTLTAIGVKETIVGTLADAIAAAVTLDEQYQRFGGVTIESDGEVLGSVEDGVADLI
jgi:hypothetical protein